MKTAIDLMIDGWLDYQRESQSESITIEKLIENALALYKPIEKSKIIDAYREAITIDLSDEGKEAEALEYYNTTFTNP